MAFVVYILRSDRDGGLYVGHTANLPRRLEQHANAHAKSYAAKRGPWTLVHCENHPDRSIAMKRERFLKSAAGAREKKRPAGIDASVG
ncbi:MAG: GIY-YIG nuclease family protein [Planctomycetota bacterium]